MEKENLISDQAENQIGISKPSPADRQESCNWCFAWAAGSPQPTNSVEKAVLIKNAKWPKGQRISISFLDGDPSIQEKVEKAAQKWVGPGMANLIFDFRKDTTDTDIRISFRFAGSWSALGTTCKKIKKGEPTMNFGWLNADSTQEEIERVVLHEFGHALGLTHEHLHPDKPIDWNRKQVEDDLSGPPNNWNPQVIYNNMFRSFEEQETNFTSLDPNSIMMYPIPAPWTNDGFTVGLNSQISAKDKEFIRQQYP